MKEGGWGKAPPELAERFRAAVGDLPGAEPRQMFGYPAAFANGYLFTGLFENVWHVRLDDAGLAELEGLGGTTFSPMPGRPMSGYRTLPQPIQDDPAALRAWLERAQAYVMGLPPKKGKGSQSQPRRRK